MALSAGTRLGPYEVVAAIGAGGMGEVYRARDTRLDRDVALKILPEAFASDPDRLMRFEREAKTLASLNHPNIAQVYGIEGDGSLLPDGKTRPHALVMELVEGEDLSALIARAGREPAPAAGPERGAERARGQRMGVGPHSQLEGRGLPLADALAIARQIAEALEAAHEQGIVHRDLKPANIKVRDDGTVKVLDFGLAKALDPNAGRTEVQSALQAGPTMTSPAMTAMGVILGTAAYMAPEQAKGRSVDRRADIWAFGCVLYEMLTGRRAFDGEDVSDLLVAVLSKDVDLSALPPAAPPRIARLIARCLDRNLKTRLQHIGEARIALEQAAEDEPAPSGAAAVTAAPPVWQEPRVWLLVTAAAAVAFAVASWLPSLGRPAPPAPAPAVRFPVAPPGSASAPMSVAVSPDGARVAFVAIGADETPRLWVRDVDAVDARPVAETDGAMLPFWSPDGAFLAFFAGGWMKKVPMAGGPVTTISEAPDPAGGAWGPDGTIVFAPGLNSGLFRVPAVGGTPTPLTSLDASLQETSHRAPAFLPDGRHFLYLERRSFADDASVVVASVDDPDRATELIPASARASNAYYAPPGYLLFMREQTLVAQRFDVDNLTLSGDPVTVAEKVGFVPRRALIGLFSVSRTGILAYGGGEPSDLQLVWVGRDGTVLSRVGPAVGSGNRYARLSPDGTRVVFPQTSLGNSDIWTLDLERGVSSRLTTDPSSEISPVWSPDGTRIAFHSDRDGGRIVARSLNAAEDETLILGPGTTLEPFDWSPDGRYLLCATVDPVTTADVYVVAVAGDSAAVPFLKTPAAEVSARFSPDGKWVAYMSDESGRWEVYVDSFPTPGRKTRISIDGGGHPMWRRDGREIVYNSLDEQLWAMSMQDGSPVGQPTLLFKNAWSSTSGGGFSWPYFGMTADGQRFLLNRNADESRGEALTVVVNWTADISK